MVRLLASIIGLGIETAYLLVLEVFSAIWPFRHMRAESAAKSLFE
jgi:hypothetical protein